MKRINNKEEGYKFIALAAFLFLLFSACYAETAQYGAIETVTETSNFKALLTALTTPNIRLVAIQPLTPGRDYAIGGSSFGYRPGQVKMTLPSGKTINLVVIDWWNNFIHVKVPPITGEKDGFASIQVYTANQSTSNKFSVNFEATRMDEKAKLDAYSAKVNAEIERLRQKSTESSSRLLSIQNEANQLNTRFRTASPSEKAQIEKRAGELLQQIKQMGY